MNELQAWHAWLAVSGALIAAELFIGSPMFVLLILGAAALVAAAGAWLGAPLWAQFFLGAAVGVSGYLWARRFHRSEPKGVNLPLDVGGRVNLVRMLSKLHAEVDYRGAVWTAESDQPGMDWNEALYVKEIRGNTLIVTTNKQ